MLFYKFFTVVFAQRVPKLAECNIHRRTVRLDMYIGPVPVVTSDTSTNAPWS